MAREGLEPTGEAKGRSRGFEDLVGEESFLPVTQGSRTPAQGVERVDDLEYRVRMTMDRLTELVEAQLPETVDELRADFEQLRTDLQSEMLAANEMLAEERRLLRSEIATTVGAANRWFVRTRDQLYERLDQIAEAVRDAQAEAATAAAAAVAAAVPVRPEPAPEPAPDTAAEPATEPPQDFPVEEATEPAAPAEPTYDEGGVEPSGDAETTDYQAQPEEAVVTFAAASEEVATGPVEGNETASDGAVATAVEWEVEEEFQPYQYVTEFPAPGEEYAETPVDAVAQAFDVPGIEGLLEPLRGDVQELQGEVAAMSAAMWELRAEVERLGERVPARAPAPRLTAGQLQTIVAAVQAALPPAPAPRRTAAKTARTPSPAAARKVATKKAVPAKKAATKVTAGKVTVKKAATPSHVRGRQR